MILLSLAMALVALGMIISKFVPIMLFLLPVRPYGNETSVLFTDRPFIKLYLTFRTVTGSLIVGLLLFEVFRLSQKLDELTSIVLAAGCSLLLLVMFLSAVWFASVRNWLTKRINRPVSSNTVMLYFAIDIAVFSILMLAAIALIVIAFALQPE